MMLLAFAVMLAAGPERCAPPVVMLGGNDKAFTVRFWAGTPRRRTMEDNVRAAFKSACKSGLLKGSTIPALNGVSARRLFLENQPNANVTSLEADRQPDGSWRLVLAYPYLAADRSMNVPTAAEIQEAIFCAVRGASKKEREESGRCLPD